jgi:hypothetical protein
MIKMCLHINLLAKEKRNTDSMALQIIYSRKNFLASIATFVDLQ